MASKIHPKVNELVSVIIPTYNREHLLREAIESVQNQTHTNFEVLVVDDGSVDATPLTIQAIQKTDPRIQYHLQSNAGPAAARNKGVDLAQGDFIAFLDSDDIWMPDKVSKQLDIFRAKPEIDFIYCNGFFQDAEGKRDEILTKQLQARIYTAEDVLFGPVSFFSTSGVMLRRKCFSDAGRFDETIKFLEDVDFWFRILLFHKAYLLDEELVINRRHGANFAQTHSLHPQVDMCRSAWQLRSKAVPLFEQHIRKLSDGEKEIVLYKYQMELIKECLAFGLTHEARREVLSYRRTHASSAQALLYFLLTYIPGKLIAWLISKRRKLLFSAKRNDG